MLTNEYRLGLKVIIKPLACFNRRPRDYGLGECISEVAYEKPRSQGFYAMVKFTECTREVWLGRLEIV